jgi:hypothetical protein
MVTAAFYDEDGGAVTPTAIHWTLKNLDGTVVNNRSGVAVAVPDTSIIIVLYGDDLAMTGVGARTEKVEGETVTVSEVRFLVVTATYNSTLGTGLPLVGVLEFRVLNTFAAGLLPSVSPSASRSPSASASPSA